MEESASRSPSRTPVSRMNGTTVLRVTVARSLSKVRNVSVTSFNRIVLLTGQVPDEDAKRRAAAEAERADQVRGVHDELVVGPPTSLLFPAARRTSCSRVTSGSQWPPELHRPDSTAPANVNVKVVAYRERRRVPDGAGDPQGERAPTCLPQSPMRLARAANRARSRRADRPANPRALRVCRDPPGGLVGSVPAVIEIRGPSVRP